MKAHVTPLGFTVLKHLVTIGVSVEDTTLPRHGHSCFIGYLGWRRMEVFMKQGSKKLMQLPLYLMLLAPVVMTFIFSYMPLGGLVIAFQDFKPAKGLFGDQKWIGLENFKYMAQLPDMGQILYNTLFMSIWKIVLGLVVPIAFALLMNEVRNMRFKKTFQTAVYLPYFLSWVLLGGVFRQILSPNFGIFNNLMGIFGIGPYYFLGEPSLFPWTMIITDVWKGFGYGTIIYLASIAGIDPALYEAAEMDGAGRFRKVISITLPAIMPIVALMATLSLGNVLSAGFDQVFNLYSAQVYSTGDIIDTYVYRMGLANAQFSFSTAVGLLKSFVSCVLTSVTYFLVYKFGNYRIV